MKRTRCALSSPCWSDSGKRQRLAEKIPYHLRRVGNARARDEGHLHRCFIESVHRARYTSGSRQAVGRTQHLEFEVCSGIAQPVEQAAVNRKVQSSNLCPGANPLVLTRVMLDKSDPVDACQCPG
jgi:hypothetical protein